MEEHKVTAITEELLSLTVSLLESNDSLNIWYDLHNRSIIDKDILYSVFLKDSEKITLLKRLEYERNEQN